MATRRGFLQMLGFGVGAAALKPKVPVPVVDDDDDDDDDDDGEQEMALTRSAPPGSPALMLRAYCSVGCFDPRDAVLDRWYTGDKK